MKRRIAASLFILCAFMILSLSVSSRVAALEVGEQDVFVRVIDSGAALCCVIKMPGRKYIIYDAGNYTGDGALTATEIGKIIEAGSEIEFLILSHSDSDHLGAVDEICNNYKVKKVIRSGYYQESGTYESADKSIVLEKEREGCIDVNLSCCEFPPGAMYRIGDVFMQMVSGFYRPPEEWGKLTTSEANNAGSIVIRLVYKGNSIIFCGDAVGRHIGDPSDVCIAEEKYMVENSDIIQLHSNVMIAPHHGGDNASSADFIKSVNPHYVIFSAGHKFHHPREEAAQRYIDAGVDRKNIYRTDLKDDESFSEWGFGREIDNTDPEGDDNVDIVLRENGTIGIEYEDPGNQAYHDQL